MILPRDETQRQIARRHLGSLIDHRRERVASSRYANASKAESLVSRGEEGQAIVGWMPSFTSYSPDSRGSLQRLSFPAPLPSPCLAPPAPPLPTGGTCRSGAGVW
ncbi:Hypothetical protein CAP_0848 [Chondromyces apiculatus DSM 436]|uniref:Uncharacterized protein n=1 Tax=Chondromyces apiculatus DSM 436 TaxID=1192034 RepID=A0A017SUE2_9BACT|nr:Hypothetical protein CAP_0848 [Chondromyces apiculatus DSM 436]